MIHVITVILVLVVSFFMGFVLGTVKTDLEAEEQAREDREQIEFIREWQEYRDRFNGQY